ncbi:MAG: serine/threonine protein kinase, partial [Myxococcota bacterium]|nr:serine/threonine protein kinase [Myxococcota bacterium]
MTIPLSELAAPAEMTVGRYVLHRQIARGGMATIHIARLMGDEGFSRIVAAKRLLPEFAEDAEFVAMFLDEARIASKVHHRNVVPVLDVVTTDDEVMLVQEYVHGAPLHYLLNKARHASLRVPISIAVSIASHVLAGLHAAHELVDELGVPLEVVHRDVSPQNVMISTDGTARLLDFGIAKATMAAHVTREGTYKGKLAYSAPEQLHGRATRQSDLYSLAVLLWELLVGHRMHGAQSEAQLVATIMNGALPTITETLGAEHEWDAIDDSEWSQLGAIDRVVRKGLAVDVNDRWKTALEMEAALVAIVQPASPTMVAAWLRSVGHEHLEKLEKVIAMEETSWRRNQPVLLPTRRVNAETRRANAAEISQLGSLPQRSSLLHRGPHVVIALLAMLVGGLVIGVIGMLRSSSDPTPTARASNAQVEVAEPIELDEPAPALASAPTPAPAARVTVPPIAEPASELALELGDAAVTPTAVTPQATPAVSPSPARRKP